MLTVLEDITTCLSFLITGCHRLHFIVDFMIGVKLLI